MNPGTMHLATALDAARHEEATRRRATPQRSLRIAIGTGLVRLGQSMLPRTVEIPPPQARPTGT